MNSWIKCLYSSSKLKYKEVIRFEMGVYMIEKVL